MSGIEVNDTVSFGGLLNLPNEKFALMESMSPSFGLSLFNGHFGVMMSPVNTTEQSQHILSQLLQSNQLLNPVVGMRFDPKNPKMTIGALDPADYEGEINWVEMETPVNSWDFPNVFKLDGIKGYNGSFLPWGNNLSASVNSLFFAVAVPNTWQYMVEDGFTGPLETISYNPDVGVISYQCNETTPYVALTATINGVDYRMDSPNNLLRPTGESRVGFCNVGITNRTQPVNIPDVDLGLPFLRSVYLAYRFPTANCPGYYGFAFPSGANRTQAEISQTPTSTPAQSAQCLSLTKPTSTPTATVVTTRQKLMSKQNYDVYMNPQANQMPLVGVDELPKAVWNTTDLNGQ
ncbi:hypothetical protein SERLADRAFT_454467 [Serpula lacrymans var. lacrymans S7.9]|nr:uncharacterized protein SERLADRAFT_454467 [Serpula lacrymans var. lacrymans S7.9]EGO30161.1 hypothetical protein SERLADRAFT_454467 [Serpula lacrymans var. lacrymans S7.9]